MSDLTIKYEEVVLYTEAGQADSVSFRKKLDDMNASYAILDYKPDAVADALAPLNTWNFDDVEGKASFSDMPLVVFHEVLWESPDGEHKYFRTCLSTSVEKLPSDFKDKVIKAS